MDWLFHLIDTKLQKRVSDKMKNKILFLVISIGILAIAGVACTPAGDEPAANSAAESKSDVADVVTPIDLNGTRWVLESFTDSEGNLVSALAGSQATLDFENGQASGQSGCNSFGGGFSVSGNALTIGQLASTLMACEESLMAQEAAFLQALSAAASYNIVDGKLQIVNADGKTVLTFTALESVALTDVNWTATTVNNGREAVTGLVAGTTITLRFAEDGTLSGSAGCNRYNSAYTIDGATITIQPPASTRMMCPEEGVMEQEQAYLILLPQAASYSIRGDQMELRTAEGALIASYLVGEAE